jgi:hypothetical protein
LIPAWEPTTHDQNKFQQNIHSRACCFDGVSSS